MREPGTARRWIGIAVRGLLLWVAVALVFWVVVLVLPGFEEHQLPGRAARDRA